MLSCSLILYDYVYDLVFNAPLKLLFLLLGWTLDDAWRILGVFHEPLTGKYLHKLEEGA